MVRVEDYPACIEELITCYGQYKLAYGDVETQIVIDCEHQHYHLLNVGWNKNERIRGHVLHTVCGWE